VSQARVCLLESLGDEQEGPTFLFAVFPFCFLDLGFCHLHVSDPFPTRMSLAPEPIIEEQFPPAEDIVADVDAIVEEGNGAAGVDSLKDRLGSKVYAYVRNNHKVGRSHLRVKLP
jgi:hypothetical protein